MGENEFKTKHKNGITNYKPDEKTSWSSDRGVAAGFGTGFLDDTASGYDNSSANVSAWIPESSLLHNPNQFNAPSDASIRNKNMYATKGNLDRSVPEAVEGEWIVQHNQPFQHANPKLIEQINKDRIRGKIKDRPFVVQKQIAGRQNLPKEDKSLLTNNQITQRPDIGTPDFKTSDAEKLTSSEIIQNDINKMSQPSLTFPKLQGIPTRPDQEVKTIDPNKKFGNVSQQELENKKVASKYAAGSIKSPAEHKANKGNYLTQIKADQVKNPNVKGYSASEVGDPYRMKDSNPMVQEHEAAHFILSKIGQHPEYGQEHKSALVNHLISHIHPEDQASISKLLSHRGYQQGSDLNEEMLNTTRDLLVDKELRNQHNSLRSKDPSNYSPIDYNRLKQTWKNINNTSQSLSREQLNSLVGKNPIMKKNEGSEKNSKNFFNHPEVKEMLHNEIKNMNHEVQNSEAGKRSGHKDDSGQHVNTSTKSTFPSHYAKIGAKNKAHFQTAVNSKKGPVYDRMKAHAHDRLLNGYSNHHGQDMPHHKYLAHAVKHGVISHDDYKDRMRAMDKSEALEKGERYSYDDIHRHIVNTKGSALHDADEEDEGIPDFHASKEYALKYVPLNKIPHSTPPNKGLVHRYKLLHQSGSEAPAIVLSKLNNEIMDGRHRVQAARELGHTHIKAFVPIRDKIIVNKSEATTPVCPEQLESDLQKPFSNKKPSLKKYKRKYGLK
jgi:hypothetical protein